MSDVLQVQLQAALGDHYAIERELTGGGMSRVFLAHETTLGRQVVVKTLAPDFAATVSADRFRREVRLAARLQQANIVPVLTAGEMNGLPYYTMPFVAGESVRARLSARTPLGIREVVGILRDVARALAFAHERGIVHRDIKPENVLLSGTTAVVTDFGIAKALESARGTATGPTLTHAGSTMGTPAYMAPEQICADPAIDHRADLYSFGVVAYELLTGSPPFTGPSPQALFAAHLTQQPIPVIEKRPDVPANLSALVMRCLAKEPSVRPPTAGDILDALDVVLTPAAPIAPVLVPALAKPSIAVLPFANLSPDPADEYFADGLTDEIITDLSTIHGLHVIARGSMMRFKGTGNDPLSVARELNVRYVLDGSVRHAGSSLRLTTRLIDAVDGRTLWADKLGGSVDDVFGMQERISRTIVDALKITLSPAEERQLLAHPISDPRAYEIFLRARQEAWLLTPSGLGRAISLINEAAAIVGENPVLNASLSCFYSLSYDFGISHDEETLAKAQDLADKALSADPNLSLALYAAGWTRYKRGEMEGIVRFAKRAVAIDRNPDALWLLGFLLAEVGRNDEARACADEAVARDPLTFIAHLGHGGLALFEGRFDAAIAIFLRASRLAPDEPFAQWWLGQAYAFGRQDREALQLFDAAASRDAGMVSAMSRVFAAALRGEREEVLRTATNEEVSSVAMTDEYYPTNLAAALAHVGEHDRALVWLEQAVRWGFTNDRWFRSHNRLLEPLRDHPRFIALMERARRRQLAFAG